MPTFDAATWAAYKAAVEEYSNYRPLLVDADVTIVAGAITGVPAHLIGVELLDYGENISWSEYRLAGAASTSQGWVLRAGVLYLTPMPADGTVITATWRTAHQCDDVAQTYATVPVKDHWIIDLLAQATLLTSDHVSSQVGLQGYSFGSVNIKWSQKGGAANANLSSLADQMRAEAIRAISTPVAEWG